MMTDISMKKKLQGKVAIITGAASGIGETTAHHFVEHGARAVVIADIQDQKGRLVAETIGLHKSSYFHCDVTDEEQVKSLVDHTVKTYGGLDIFFSNAGTLSGGGLHQTVVDLDLSTYDRVMRVNARGMATCVKHAALKMIELGTRGSIVCTASSSAKMGGPNMTDYIMSKHAVLGLMRSASVQLGVHGIRVNCLSPGLVATPLAGVMGIETIDDVVNFLGPLISLKGVSLTTAHLAEAVAFLASDESAYVTGHNLIVDGGLVSLPLPN